MVLGATNLAESEALQAHHQRLFGPPVSDSTTRRTLAVMDTTVRGEIGRVRARVRRHVWTLLHLRPGGFPWLTVAGKHLHRWIVIDVDATIITAASRKEGATGTFKKTFGHHPLAAWCANTGECLAMLLRPGNAGSNTAADHIQVLCDALAQTPGQSTAKILVRVDGAGATHELLKHLAALNTRRRTVRFTTGWTITDADEKAIAKLPEKAWEDSLKQNGEVQEGYGAAELTDLNTRKLGPRGPAGMTKGRTSDRSGPFMVRCCGASADAADVDDHDGDRGLGSQLSLGHRPPPRRSRFAVGRTHPPAPPGHPTHRRPTPPRTRPRPAGTRRPRWLPLPYGHLMSNRSPGQPPRAPCGQRSCQGRT